jgi:RHS repeat-associated protein
VFYDARNQLVDFDSQATFTYDQDGRRISATANSVTTNYLWDEFSQYGDVILETSGANVLSYTLANGAVLSQTNNGITNYLLPDAQNSTRAVVNAAGNITSNYDYDAFGNLQGTPSLETNYLYTGQQFDDVSELYSLRARYYDASIGRFLSSDTWAYDYGNPVELNRYVYAANNPVTWSDPSGYSATAEAGGYGAAFGGFITALNAFLTPQITFLGFSNMAIWALVVALSGVLVGEAVADPPWGGNRDNEDPFKDLYRKAGDFWKGLKDLFKDLPWVYPIDDSLPDNPPDDDDEELITYVHFSTATAVDDILKNGIKPTSGVNSPRDINGNPDLRFFAITEQRGPYPRPTRAQVYDMMNAINRGIQKDNPGVATGLLVIMLPLSVVEKLEGTRDIIYRPFFRKPHLMKPGYMESVFETTSFTIVNQYRHLWSRAF